MVIWLVIETEVVWLQKSSNIWDLTPQLAEMNTTPNDMRDVYEQSSTNGICRIAKD